MLPAKSKSAARKLPAPSVRSAASSPQISMNAIPAAVPVKLSLTEQNAAHSADVIQPAPVTRRRSGVPPCITAVRCPSDITS